MGLLDKLTGNKDLGNQSKVTPQPGLTEKEILQSFRQSCWDLFVSNLPDPKIVNAETAREKNKLPKNVRVAVPRGFYIVPKTWTTYFNSDDVPNNLEYTASLDKYVAAAERASPGVENRQYSRSIFQHETTHFTKVPGDRVTEAILVDSALKGFKDQNIVQNKKLASDYAYLVLNIMGDLIGDTFLAKEKYGRDDFGDLTLWRQKETVKDARKTQQAPSLLWRTLVSAYEKLWNEDLGLKDHVQKKDNNAEKVAQGLVDILGSDWKDRTTWEAKIRKFATILEPIIKQTAQDTKNQRGNSRYGRNGQGKSGQGKNQQQGGEQNDGMPIPDDVKSQMGEPTKSPLGEQEGGEKVSRDKGKDGKGKSGKNNKNDNHENSDDDEAANIDENALDEVYHRNERSPGKFAGTMGVLHKLEPDDALRLMYRARAKELLISMKEADNQRAEKAPSYQTAWNVGDPIIGKGGLEIIPSIMASGKPIPGLTTYKRKAEVSEGVGRLKRIPDLFISIDSSGSMGWDKWADNPEARGDFDKAILAAEGAALYAIENGGKVAAINFSGEDNITVQDYTDDINKVEMAVMTNYSGGTVVPVKEVEEIIKKTTNPLQTCLMSDCDISNWQEACDAFAKGISEYDDVFVVKLNPSTGRKFAECIEERGAVVHKAKKIEDLVGIVIGQVKRRYDSAQEEEDAD
ncbi:hypothetical protein HYT56_04265 [Candidatus Woesearchaeota archaeon]|nr:hypothetical protein [Candidatus Woesearchaeota archaeon]